MDDRQNRSRHLFIKLKEKKRRNIKKQEQKQEELFIEEFVSTRNAMQS